MHLNVDILVPPTRRGREAPGRPNRPAGSAKSVLRIRESPLARQVREPERARGMTDEPGFVDRLRDGRGEEGEEEEENEVKEAEEKEEGNLRRVARVPNCSPRERTSARVKLYVFSAGVRRFF
jgi:hypothetical protein